MKLAFFLIAFCLVFLRVYFFWTGYGDNSRGDVTITVDNGSDYEQIKYTGHIKLTDDESGIQSISPGGFLKYRRNEIKLVAESNLEGEIHYKLYEDDEPVYSGNRPNAIIAEAIREMIAYGFDAQGRMERIYKKDGFRGLLNELDKLKAAGVKSMYMDRLFLADSLSEDDWVLITKRIGELDNDQDKVKLLKKYTTPHFNNEPIMRAWFAVVENIGSDMDKINTMQRLLDGPTISDENFNQAIKITEQLGPDMDKVNLLSRLIDKGDVAGERIDNVLSIVTRLGADMDRINVLKLLAEKQELTGAQLDKLMNIISGLGSDNDKENMLTYLINKGIIRGDHFDKVLDLAAQFGSDMDKVNMYKKLLEEKYITEGQWINIIQNAGEISSDLDKANLLVLIAQKMPESENLKTAYLKTAKTIAADTEYRTAVKALE